MPAAAYCVGTGLSGDSFEKSIRPTGWEFASTGAGSQAVETEKLCKTTSERDLQGVSWLIFGGLGFNRMMDI